jgi:hypothetical protein
MARQPAPPAPPAPPVTLPPCRRGYRCGDSDRRPATDDLHSDACMLSAASRSRRRARIDALTPAQMRDALDFLSGWSAAGVDGALARTCRECRTDAPWHTAQCTLRPGAEPAAVPVAVTP